MGPSQLLGLVGLKVKQPEDIASEVQSDESAGLLFDDGWLKLSGHFGSHVLYLSSLIHNLVDQTGQSLTLENLQIYRFRNCNG